MVPAPFVPFRVESDTALNWTKLRISHGSWIVQQELEPARSLPIELPQTCEPVGLECRSAARIIGIEPTLGVSEFSPLGLRVFKSFEQRRLVTEALAQSDLATPDGLFGASKFALLTRQEGLF